MPTEKNKHVSSTHDKNTLKNAFIIYADLECLLYPISTCDNTPNNSFTIKKMCTYHVVFQYLHHMLMINH